MDNFVEKNFIRQVDSVKISSILLTVILILLPFDSYFGEIVQVPFIPALLVLFVFVCMAEFAFSDYKPTCYTSILLFMVYAVITNLIGLAKVGATYNVMLLFTNIVFVLVAISRQYNKKELNIFIKTAPYSLLLFIIICLVHMEIKNDEIFMAVRKICDPNYFTTNMVLVLAMQMFIILQSKEWWKKILYSLELAAAFALMILIASRGGLITWIVTILIAIIIGSKKPVRLLLMYLVFAIFFIYVLLPLLPPYLQNKFSPEEFLHGTGSGRTIIWKNYLTYYINSDATNIIFGFGRDYIPSIYASLFGSKYYPHNLYVKTITETGILGSILFVALVLISLKKLINTKNGLIISAFIGMLAGAMFLDMDNMRIFWLLLVWINITAGQGRITMWRGKCEIFNNCTYLQRR